MSLRISILSRPLIKNSFIYVITDSINKAIPFLLLPIITHYIIPSEYGLITNFNVLVQILSVFCYSSTLAALPARFYKLDRDQIKKYVSNMLIINTLATILILLLLLLFHQFVEAKLKMPLFFQIGAIILVWFASITNVNLVLWRCEERAFAFGKYQISQSLLNAITTIVFVIIFLLGWKGRVYSYIFSSFIFGLFSLFILRRKGYFELTISKDYIKQILHFGIPLIPLAISYWFKSGFDKIIITDLCGMAENGLYSVAMTLGAIVTMILSSFNSAYGPHVFKKLAYFDESTNDLINEKRQLVKLTYGFILLMILLVFIIYWMSYAIIYFVYDLSYRESVKYLPYIMISQFFYGGYLMFVCYFYHCSKTKTLGIVTFLLSVVQILLAYFLINSIGAVGVVVASALISFITFVFVMVYAMRIYKLPWFNLKNR
ncbi:MAG: lipopolysaccharide biosynthesis protein [Dysgonomonas sp.]